MSISKIFAQPWKLPFFLWPESISNDVLRQNLGKDWPISWEITWKMCRKFGNRNSENENNEWNKSRLKADRIKENSYCTCSSFISNRENREGEMFHDYCRIECTSQHPTPHSSAIWRYSRTNLHNCENCPGHRCRNESANNTFSCEISERRTQLATLQFSHTTYMYRWHEWINETKSIGA